MHWNAEGVFRKKDELHNMMETNNVDICCIQETHLSKDKVFKLHGWQPAIRTDREDRHKGGIMTLVRNKINVGIIFSR